MNRSSVIDYDRGLSWHTGVLVPMYMAKIFPGTQTVLTCGEFPLNGTQAILDATIETWVRLAQEAVTLADINETAKTMKTPDILVEVGRAPEIGARVLVDVSDPTKPIYIITVANDQKITGPGIEPRATICAAQLLRGFHMCSECGDCVSNMMAPRAPGGRPICMICVLNPQMPPRTHL